MQPVRIEAFISTTPFRRSVREQTIANLARSDWGAPPTIVIDRGRFTDDRGKGSTDNARHVLETAVQRDTWDVMVFLEDDVDVNRNLRHNLERWPPIVDLARDGYLCGSLYNPNIGSLDPAADGDTFRIVDPELPYGSQGVVLSRSMVNWILDGWFATRGLGDIRIFHLAARKAPIHYHRPSLIEHQQVPSTWGGVPHTATDFDADFRAPEPVRP